MAQRIDIVEVGPRDGLQIAHGIMKTEDKIRWIESLAAAGLATIEVGSFVPPKLVPQMADTEAVVRSVAKILPDLQIAALAPNLKGVERAYDAGAHIVLMPISVTEGHSRANTNKGTFEAVAEFRRSAAWLRAQSRQTRLEAGCSMSFGCSIDGIVPVSRVVEVAVALADAGADSVALADTVGYADPTAIRQKVRAVKAEIGERLHKLHLHDTFGLGLSNVLAGLDEGIHAFDAALAGLGGCPFAPGAAGNVTTEDLVYMLDLMGYETAINLDRLLEAREILARGLPSEPLRGSLGKAGIPKFYRDEMAGRHPASRATVQAPAAE